MSDTVEKIPIFPLGVVLLPGLNMPLHIFEERYKSMINKCLEEEKEFGIVHYDGSRLQSTGCLARIKRVTKCYPDGRMDIATIGTRRFQIREILEEKVYMEARVRFFDDHDLNSTSFDTVLHNKAVGLLFRIAELTGSEPVNLSVTGITPQQLSFIIAGSSGFTVNEKQRFQEMTSTSERLEKGIAALEKIVERIQINLDIRKIVGGNGHLPELLP